MKDSTRYAKIVEWSEAGQYYVDSAPGLILGGCHGEDERQVLAELCQVVQEDIDLDRQDGKPLPTPAAGHDLANTLHGAG